MRSLSNLTLSLGCALLGITNVYAYNTSPTTPTTYLGTSFQAGFTGSIDDSSALNVAAEIGRKNYRVGGSLGYNMAPNRRFKFTAEYLGQDLTYAFFSGNRAEWVSQVAVGGDYQFDLPYRYNPQIDILAYYSHAANKNAEIARGSYVRNGATVNFIDNRHVAGSNAGGISPMLTVQPWHGTRAGLGLNYDYVHYTKIFTPTRLAYGFGGTAVINQVIVKNIELGLMATVRAPYNDYEANLVWSNVPDMGRWAVGINGAYTVGKYTLPNSYNAGISLNYYFDQRVGAAVAPATGKPDLKGEAAPMPAQRDDLLVWTSRPAVHMPQVLDVRDNQSCVGNNC